LQLAVENSAPKDKVVFFDRALPEGIAYCQFGGLDIGEYSQSNWPKFKNRYRKVFFCQQLPFNKDCTRIENEKTANELSRLIREVYVDLDYKIIDLPSVSVGERLRIVLDEIGK
jgi:predicted ATPase